MIPNWQALGVLRKNRSHLKPKKPPRKRSGLLNMLSLLEEPLQ